MTATTAAPSFLAGIAPVLAEIEETLAGEFGPYSPLLRDAASHLLQAGGKRLRPALVLLAAEATGGIQPGHHVLAKAVELLHTATLIHDDILDEAPTRRGRPSVGAHWGQKVAVIAGDFLLARSSLMVSELGMPSLNALYARTVMDMCEGEIRQQIHRRQTELATYLDVIERKTAILMAAGCEGAAMLNRAPQEQVAGLREYGLALGTAFQVVDDLLDFTGNVREVGKAVGSDLREGFWTAPVLFACESNPELMGMLTGEKAEQALALIQAGPGLARANELAVSYVSRAKRAMEVLPAGAAHAALAEMAEFVLARRH